MKHNWKKSTLAFLLTLLMLMLLAGMGLPAYAYDGDPYTALIATVDDSYVSVESVTLNKTDISLTKGATETLTAAVAPADTTFKTVRWSSSDPSIATVDENGKVTAVGPGTATITAAATNGTADTADDKSATCTVTVHIDVSYLTLYDYYAIVNVSDSKKLPTVV